MKNKKLIFIISAVLAILVVIVLVGIYSFEMNKPGEINVKTEKTAYQTGEALKVKIENNLRKNICFSSCYPYYFEKKDGKWISYHYDSCPNSNLAENCLKPKQVKAFEIIIPSINEEGIHRLALPACLGCNLEEKFREDKWLYSNDFVIK